MSESVKMPALGESVTEGTVTQWLKSVGDQVEVDEPLLEVSTDKVDTEVPSPIAGVLEKVLVDEDDTVEVGADLAMIGDGSGGGEQPQQQAPAQESAAQETPQQEQQASQQQEPAQQSQQQSEQAQEQPSEQQAAPAQASSGSSSGGGAQRSEERRVGKEWR